MTNLDDLLQDMQAQFYAIIGAQTKAFCDKHLDKMGTHEVLYYPRTESEDEDGFIVYKQLIVLAPLKTCVLDYRSDAAKTKFPYTYITWKIKNPLNG